MAAKLFKTLRDCDAEELQELISKGASVNEADKKGLTPLMECANQGFEEGITILLAAGAKATAQDKKDGRTALIVAAIEGQVECVKALLGDQSVGSFINMTDTGGMTALHWALKLQQEDVSRELIGHSAIKLGLVAKDGYTPLMHAAQIGNTEIVQALLKSNATKATLSSTDKKGNTALHLAAICGHVEVAEALHAASPSSLNAGNQDGETPLHQAAAEDNVAVVKWLIEQGAELKPVTKHGLTPYQVSEPSSASAKAIADKTGEVAAVASADEPEDETKAHSDDEPVAQKTKEEPKSILFVEASNYFALMPIAAIRKRTKPPMAAISKKGKQEAASSPLIARLLLVLIVGSSLTYLLSMFF